jgi:hypothetical protein
MCPRHPTRNARLSLKRRIDVTTTATQAAQDMLGRLSRAAALFGDAGAVPEFEAAADPHDEVTET